MRVAAFVVLMGFVAWFAVTSGCEFDARAQTGPDVPPRASLIQLVGPVATAHTTLVANAGAAPANAELHVANLNTSRQEPIAQQSVTIEGRVLDGSERPVSGVRVDALNSVSGSFVASSPAQSDGSFRLTVPAGIYIVTAGVPPPSPLLPTYVRVDARGGNVSNLVLRLTAQTPLVPDDPPRASLIQVSPPDAAGDATVTGAAGAVAPGSFLVLVTLDTGHAVTTQAGDDGSFRASIFGPFGASILIKADPFGFAFRLANNNFLMRNAGPALSLLAGTIVRVPEPPAGGSGAPFGRAGGIAGGFGQAIQDPAWTFQGAVASQGVEPGGTLQIDGSLRIVSPALQQAGQMEIVASVTLDKVSGPDGSGSLAENTFASTLLTPTGLPIERQRNGRIGNGLGQSVRVVLVKTAPDRAEAPIHFAFTLPANASAGFYVPVVTFFFDGVPVESTPSRFAIPIERSGRRQVTMTYLPVVRVGSPAPPRIPAMLLAETLSNGTRGVRAIEDRGRFGLSSRIRMDDTFIVPRVDGSGQPLTYRLEPFLPTVSLTVAGQPNLPLIPFRFPSGRLTLRIQAPNGSVSVIGPSPFLQPRLKSNGLLGTSVRDTGGFLGVFTLITECYQLSTLDPSFEVKFAQDGHHAITLEGAIEDIWGNTWTVGGTYEVNVARRLSVDTAALPGTPFETGDVLSPAVVVSPPVPADIEVRVRLAPNSDPARMIERVVRGRANRFGYFSLLGSGVAFDEPGEYRVDVVVSFTDANGTRWMGTRTWGGVVAPRDTPIIAHGRRGMVNSPHLGSQWFFRSQTAHPTLPDATHPNPPFHSGDVFWAQKSDSAFVNFTFQDPGGLVTDLLRTRQRDSGLGPIHPAQFDERASIGELPLFSTRADGIDPHIDPSRVDLWGYSYRFVERPMIAVREVIGEDRLPLVYWPFNDPYAGQIGAGKDGDLPNDFKFQYGGVVLRGAALARPLYGVYGSLFVLVPDDDPGGGTRVFPPFQGNGGGPTGGPIMKLKGREIDLFIHLTGVRPGAVLEEGDNFSLVGGIGPPLPALVSTKVTTPAGRTLQFSGRANRAGYYFRPQDDFAVAEPGIYTVDLRVTFDGRTSAGQVSEPFPTGDVLGSANGRFFVYVVPRDSALLTVNLPETMTVAAPGQLDITARAPVGQSLTSGHVTAMMPGFLLQTNQLTASADALAYRYDPASLARDFPNLDLNPPADVITLSLFGQTANAQGQPSYAARVLTLHGQEFFNLTPTRAPARTAASVSAASFSGATLASESIVAAFGTGLAITTQAAATLPLPTSLAGTTISVKDSAGTERLAPLFFVSPGQLNYQMPPGTAPGAATVTITNRYGDVSVGMVQIAAVAPGLFAANANGQGVAAAFALRVKADGAQELEPVSRFDPSQNKFVSVPTDLGPDTDQVFLILFGTGTRFRSSLSTVSTRIGGVDAPVLFVGAQGDFVGLDQINLQIPRSLIGRGEVEIRLTADGQQANPVSVNIK